MEFISIPDRPEDELTHCFIYNDEIILGKYRVMYGYRLRGGFLENKFYEFDICCGDKEANYENLFQKICIIIKDNPIDDPFLNIPEVSKVKPYINDTYFILLINKLHREALEKQG